MIDIRAIAEVRQKHPGVVLLARTGNDYEAVGEDAGTVEKTGYCVASGDPPTARVPGECVEKVILTLVRSGRKVGILDPPEEGIASETIPIPRREVLLA